MKFIYLDIFLSLKLHILMEKIFSISLMLNFTPNTLDCYERKLKTLCLGPPSMRSARRKVEKEVENSTFVIYNVLF